MYCWLPLLRLTAAALKAYHLTEKIKIYVSNRCECTLFGVVFLRLRFMYISSSFCFSLFYLNSFFFFFVNFAISVSESRC